MASDPICPCDGAPDERTIDNAPAQPRVGYRVGDFRSFRRALLSTPAAPFDQEQQLTGWRPGATDDLAVQMAEWWAYLADILTFYNERIANESYLRTASQPENLRRLIRTLGYRPKAGVAASGMLAALVGGHQPVTLPKGLPVDSKPGPGEQPQTFELDADTTVSPTDTVPAAPPAYAFAPDETYFLVAGTKPPFKSGSLLLVESPSDRSSPQLLTVADLQQETGPNGTAHTRVGFTGSAPFSKPMPARDLLLSQATQSMASSSIDASAVSRAGVHLTGLARDLHAGDLVLVTGPEMPPELRWIGAITEEIWYANFPHQRPQRRRIKYFEEATPAENDPTVPPASPAVPIVVIHSYISFDTLLPDNWPPDLGATVVRYGWRSAGQLLDQPVTTYSGGLLDAKPPATFRQGDNQSILIADAANLGMGGIGSSVDGNRLTVSEPVPATTLTPPLSVHYNLLPVSRGKSVAAEVLGSGNASIAGQSFALKKSPLTYLARGDGVASTLRIRVDGREWKEVASFYEQPADAEIFVTREDDDQKTHVMFGDGVNGARLPTNADNVVASYRYGSGAKSPAAGTLTVIGKPYPNLKALRNPVAVGGGGDPDPADKIRRLAPRSAMTFGRAISGDDYQAVAAQAPSVTRAQAIWSFDADEQRSTVKIYVGDDDAAVTSARNAIKTTADPHRHVVVAAATPIPISLSLHLLVDRRYDEIDVKARVSTALLDDDTGLFGARRLGIGEAVFDSQIDAACVHVNGVVAVHGIDVTGDSAAQRGERHAPAEGAYYTLTSARLIITFEMV